MSLLRELESSKINSLLKPNSPFIKQYFDIDSFLPEKSYLRGTSEERKVKIQRGKLNNQQQQKRNLPHYDSRASLRVQRNLFGVNGSSSSASQNENSDSFEDKENNCMNSNNVKNKQCSANMKSSKPQNKQKTMTYEIFTIYNYIPPDNKSNRSTQTEALQPVNLEENLKQYWGIDSRKGSLKSIIDSGFLTPKEAPQWKIGLYNSVGASETFHRPIVKTATSNNSLCKFQASINMQGDSGTG